MDYKQAITIDDFDYTAYIIRKNPDKSEILIVGCGCEYACETKDEDAIKRLKCAFRGQESLKYSAKFISQKCQLEIKSYHLLFKMEDIHLLTKKTSIISENMIIDERIKKLESKQEKIIPIYEEDLGPGIICEKNKMEPETVFRELQECIKTSQKTYNLPYDITYFYNIEYVHQEELPIVTKNQIYFNKLIRFMSGKELKILNMKDSYTILTRKYGKKVIGLIRKSSNNYFIILNIKINYQRILPSIKNELLNGLNVISCSETDYYKYCYIIKNPELCNGIYFLPNDQIALIRENKLYVGLENLKNNSFYDICSNNYEYIKLNKN